MGVVFLLEPLFAGGEEVVTADGDDVVAAVVWGFRLGLETLVERMVLGGGEVG